MELAMCVFDIFMDRLVAQFAKLVDNSTIDTQ